MITIEQVGTVGGLWTLLALWHCIDPQTMAHVGVGRGHCHGTHVRAPVGRP